MKEVENQYFYIYFAVAIILPQASQIKIVKASNVRSFYDYVIAPDHLQFNYMLLLMNTTETKPEFRGKACESLENHPVHRICLNFVSPEIAR